MQFSKTALSLSDVQLSTDIHPATQGSRFVKNGAFVMPLPGMKASKDQPLYVHFEIYNLTLNDSGRTYYQIDYLVREAKSTKGVFSKIGEIFGGKRAGKSSVTLSQPRTGNWANPFEYVALDLSELRSRELLLTVSVTDRVSMQRTSSTVPITLLDKPAENYHLPELSNVQ
jgi:hypothetical protein